MTKLYNKIEISKNGRSQTLTHIVLDKYKIQETAYHINTSNHDYIISIHEYNEHYCIDEEIILGTVTFHCVKQKYVFYTDSRLNSFTDETLRDIATIVSQINIDYEKEGESI